jgi:RNA polymerase sigma-70 factor (ECF subfamily)
MAADEDWLLATVRRYQGPLLTYVGRLLGRADGARDVVQETFLKLCRQERSEVEPRLAAWLFSVCRNHVRDLQRKEQRMIAARPDVARSPADSQESHDAVDGHEQRLRCQELLAELPQSQQEVVRLKFLHELSYQEISEVTGLTVGNVGYILHHALLKLRQRMEGKPAKVR